METAEQLAAPDRRYGSGEQIPWQEDSFPVADWEGIDVYGRIHGHFAEAEEALVPLSESRELMRVLAACRQDAEG